MQYHLPVFENLCPTWSQVLSYGIRRSFPKGSQIFDLDTEINGVYLVTEGVVEVILYTASGPRKALFFVGQGCLIGEISCYVSGGYSEAYALARTDCVVYYFPREAIEGPFAHQKPELLIEMIRCLAYKIRMYTIHLRDSLDGDNFIRVCKMLIYLAHFKGVDLTNGQKLVSFPPGITQTDLAKLIGIHRVTVTKEISRLKEMGIVAHFSRNNLVISDLPALVALIDQNDLPIDAETILPFQP